MAMRRMRRSRRAPVRRNRFRSRKGFGRRRIIGRTAFGRGKDGIMSTTLMNTGAWNYKRKRFNPRLARRRMIAASDASSKSRTYATITGTASTGVAVGSQNVYFRALVEDAAGGLRFWQAGGGLVFQDGGSATTDFGGNDLFVRGGRVSHSFHNNSVVDIKLRTWVAKTSRNGSIPTNPVAVPSAWDPSLPTTSLVEDIYRLYSFRDELSVIIKPGEAWERTSFVAPQKVDQSLWIANQNRDFFIYSLENMTSAVAATLQVVANYNLTFTGDKTVT